MAIAIVGLSCGAAACSPKDIVSPPAGLAQFAFLQLPIEDVGEDLFQQCTEHLRDKAQSDPAVKRAISEAKMFFESHRDWSGLQESEQVSELLQVEQLSWFQTLSFHIKNFLFEHPALWKHIGYEGSSLEDGGYINRGFDGIDWLPEVGQ